MDDYWARWSGKLRQITEPYERLERGIAPRSLPTDDLIEYYRCLGKLMRPLHLLQENRESPGDRLIGACEALEERLELLSKAHPWFSEDESTRGTMELLEIFTTRRSVEGEALEEKIRTIEMRIVELEMDTEF